MRTSIAHRRRIIYLQPLAPSLVLVLTLATSLLASCASYSSQSHLTPEWVTTRSWTYADLRLIDPIDAPKPEQELVAAYLRKGSNSSSLSWELRLDFLEMPMRNPVDIYCVLDYAPSGNQDLPFSASTQLTWDALLYLPAIGEPNAIDAAGKTIPGLALLVQRDPDQASLQVSLDGAALYPLSGSGAPPEIAIQVFILDPLTHQLTDQSDPLRSAAFPPPPARLLLAFNNAFPAYTPAQALRRWDGAHTGPLGGRHGLANLLRLARNHAIPLALLDLRYPAWLSALEYAGDMEQVASLADSGLLILPEYLPEPGYIESLPAYTQEISRRFDLPASQIGYAQYELFQPVDQRLLALSIRSDDPLSTIYQQGNFRILPIPLPATSQPELQPDVTGLSQSARLKLVDAALRAAGQPDAALFLVLGGDLTASSWGNPEVIRAAFTDIRNHPWIQPVSAYDLNSMPVSQYIPDIQPYYTGNSALLSSLPWDSMLAQAPTEVLQEAALQSALALLPPVAPANPKFAALQAIYSRQVNVLLAADQWARQPQPAASCETDLDLDGEAECMLASENLYLVFDPSLGALTHAFTLANDGPHQLIAPSSQLTFGTSDPAAWDPSAGLLADPNVIPGAFYDGVGAYQVQVTPGQLTLVEPAQGITKTFTLLPDGLRVEYHSDTPLAVRLPLALDPWVRFEPGWGEFYKGETNGDGWQWGIVPASNLGAGIQVLVTTSGRLQAQQYTDTRSLMNQVENPNTEYPPGHYLPFPLALAEITGRGDFWIELTISK